MPGPPPNPNAIRRNKHDEGHLVVVDPGEVPEKLKKLRNYASKKQATQEWWAVWAQSEQAAYFTATDWLRLRAIAELVEKYFRAIDDPRSTVNGVTLIMAEIRQNESLLGATIMDRMRMRLRAKQAGALDDPPSPDKFDEEDDDLYHDLS